MLGPREVLTRRREQGIIISISICQWALEVANMIVYLSYVFLLYGQHDIMDNVFHLYLITFCVIVQPSFYLMGDVAFRNDLSNKGLMSALRIALIDR